MARRSRDDGSVYRDAARGCWVGAVSLGRNPETGKRIRRKVSAASKDECKELLRGLLAEKDRTGTVARRDTTVEKVVRDRLANEPDTVRSPITRRVHVGHAERITAELGRVRLVQLTPSQVERFLRKMADGGYAHKTMARAAAAMDTIFGTGSAS